MPIEFSPELQDYIKSIFAEQGKREKAQKLERFRRLNKFVKKGQILFCGSSLMEQFPVNELLTDLDVPLAAYNRGVGGFTTAEMADALEECVFALEPKHIFINIGTNDLNEPDCDLDALIARYEAILNAIRARLPLVGLTLLAYYPVNREVGMRDPFMSNVLSYRTNERIRAANEKVRLLAVKMDAEYLDLNAGITDSEGSMKADYTIEGMHMYPDGYMEVLNQLLPSLRSLT